MNYRDKIRAKWPTPEDLAVWLDHNYDDWKETDPSLVADAVLQSALGVDAHGRMKQLSKRELGTVLAALRMWQTRIQTHAAPQEFVDIATDCGIFQPLNAGEIDELCERLNFGVVKIR